MGVTTVVKDYGTAILNAIRDNDLKTLRSIFEKHLNSDQKIAALCITDIKHKPTKKFACPLILAARQEDPSIIHYMLERGVDPNFVHHTIYTSKRREVVTALHIAVDLSLFPTVEVLLNANADPNITDHNDETALHVAVKKSDRVMTRMLLAKGADPSVVDRRGNAALHIATLFGHLQLVKTLLKYDADVYQKGHLGAIPSHIAAREGHIHLIQVFCSRDVGNINIKIPCFADQREKAPIHLAAENGHVETVLALVDQFNAEVNLRDSDGNTPLHCCVLNPYHPYKMRDKDYFYATAKVLVKSRVAINEKNKFGETALHLAAAHHYQKIVELLLSVGANPFVENDQHLKPIDVVPEKDPVTKQLLKNAMANPRAAPLSASMLSLQRDLNISSMGLPPTGNNRVPMLMNGLPPRVDHSRINASFGSVSSMASVFVDDPRARQMAPQLKSHKGTSQPLVASDARLKGEQDNEIQPFSEERRRSKDRKERHSSKERHQRRDSGSIMGSQLSVNSLDDEKKRRGERHKNHHHHHHHHHHKGSTVERQNAKNEQRTKSFNQMSPGVDDDDESASPVISPAKTRHGRKNQPVYENLNTSKKAGRDAEADIPSKRSRKDRKKREEEEEMERSVVPYNAQQGDYMYGEDEGVKVHTIPGKPSMIEVQYDRGPITISVDTQGTGFDPLPGYGQLEDDSDGEFSWDDGEDMEDEEPQEISPRKRSKRIIELDEEKDEKPSSRRGSKHSKGSDNVYANQEQMLKEMQQKQHQNELLKKKKLMEERESRMREEAEKRREEKEEEERKARKEEEKAKKRAKKLQRRMQRQEQFANELEFEAMPTEEEPPERPAVVELPEEVLNEPSFDSDSFEAEQESSRKALITSAQRRLSATTESIKKRWSQDEGESDEDEKLPHSAVRQDSNPVAAKRVIKPPRPVVSQTSEELEIQPTVENLLGQKNTVSSAIDVGETEPMPSDVKVQKVMGQEKGNTYEVMLKEVTNNEVIRMETVVTKQPNAEDEAQKKISKGEFMTYDQEPGSLNRSRDASSPGEFIRQGLNMRVTGEVPKAYNRKDKSSARAAFMRASPVGIESSSEASDSELGGSRSSLTRSPALEHISAQRQKEWSEPLKPFYVGKSPPAGKVEESESGSGSGSGDKPRSAKLGASYAKPYQSFGPIETKTDALEEAILEAEKLAEEKRLRSNELSTFSPTASTKANVDLHSTVNDQNVTKSGNYVTAPSQDSHLPTIISSSTKVSNQFPNVENFGFDWETSKVQGNTTVVQGLVIPVVSHVKETDIVSTGTDDDDDDDFFDDETFDDVSEEDRLEDKDHEGAEQMKHDAMGTSDVGSQSEMPSSALSPPDLLQGPHIVSGDKTKSTESVKSFQGDLEVYDQEPGARKPRSRSGMPGSSEDANLKIRKQDVPIFKSSAPPLDDDVEISEENDEHIPEDDEVAMINSKAEVKQGSKKPAAGSKTMTEKGTAPGEEFSTVPGKSGGSGKKSKGKQKKTKNADLMGEGSEVWKEAMQDKPLASSEMFEREPNIREHFTALNLQDQSQENILAGSEEIVSELPKRTGKKKKKTEKKRQPQKNAALVSELQNNFRFQRQGSQEDEISEDLSISGNNLDIKIPHIESKWKELNDQSIDNSLDISIPTADSKYLGDKSKWKPVKLTSEPRTRNMGQVNLDEIIIPGQADLTSEESFNMEQAKTHESAKEERIMGRRQERLAKQGIKGAGEKVPHVTNLDDISIDSVPEQESSSTIDAERKGNELKSKKKSKGDKRSGLTDEESVDVSVLNESFDEDMDMLPPGVRSLKEKPKYPTPGGVVKPPKPQKPSNLTTAPAVSVNDKEKPAGAATKPMFPAKRQIPPMANGVGPASQGMLWRSNSAGAEIVEMPYMENGQGIQLFPQKSDIYRRATGQALPKFPPRSIDDSQKPVLSDTEFGRAQRLGKYGRLGPVHSEAEASDMEMPVAPGPGKSYRQAALETINRRPRRTFVLRQPGHHDKSFAYLKKLYKPQMRHSVTRHLMPTAGRYGDSEILRLGHRSATESEGDTDNECSYIFDEDGKQIPMRRPAPITAAAAAAGRGRGKTVTIREGMPRGRPGYNAVRRDEAPRIMEPGPVDFSKYGVTARLWMEQVDRKTVLKSETMYLSVLPQGQELPDEIIQRAKYQSALAGDSSTMPLQWVMARGRAIALKSRAAGEPRPDCANMSGYDSELNLFHSSSPTGRQLILFFKVGSNWLDLAWVLFDGLQSDSDTVRMIKDIQLKNPETLTSQVHDLMHRWWKKKGAESTIDELQKALDTVHLPYIHEEYFDPRASFVPHTDTEDDLDVGEISGSDHNVSRIAQEYEVRSLNASFVGDTGRTSALQELNPEVVLRQLQKARDVAPGSTTVYTRASRSRAESRDSSFERQATRPTPNQTSSQERLNESSGEERKTPSINVVNKKFRKSVKHETNL